MLDIRSYRLVVAPTRSGFVASSPDVPGVQVHADGLEECIWLARTALAVELEIALARGGPLPAPSGPGVKIEAAERHYADASTPAISIRHSAAVV